MANKVIYKRPYGDCDETREASKISSAVSGLRRGQLMEVGVDESGLIDERIRPVYFFEIDIREKSLVYSETKLRFGKSMRLEDAESLSGSANMLVFPFDEIASIRVNSK